MSKQVLFPWRQVRFIFKMDSKTHPSQKTTTPNKPGIALNLNETGDLLSFFPDTQSIQNCHASTHIMHPRVFLRYKARILKGVFQNKNAEPYLYLFVRQLSARTTKISKFRDRRLFYLLLLEWFYFILHIFYYFSIWSCKRRNWNMASLDFR